MRVEDAKELLDRFHNLPGRIERPRTFMEIAGYPHYENVCSNILAFYMDPTESHGFGTLMLNALLNDTASGIDKNLEINGDFEVAREVPTRKNNRIDILMTSGTHAILIENKIYAAENNPFRDYAEFLEKEYSKVSERKKLLLTLFPSSEGKDQGFENLTHSELIERIRSILGEYLEGVDHRHLTLFLDFLNTMENFQKGGRMNPEFVKLLADKDDDIKKLFKNMKSFRSEMRAKCEELNSLVKIEHPLNVKQDYWRNNVVDMFDNLYYRFDVSDDLRIGIDAHITPQGWKIQVFPKPEKDQNRLTKLQGILDDLGIQFKESGDWWRLLYTKDFAYDENLQKISQHLQDLINKLATYKEKLSV